MDGRRDHDDEEIREDLRPPDATADDHMDRDGSSPTADDAEPDRPGAGHAGAVDDIGEDEDTAEIPVVAGPARSPATGLWLGAGAIAGLVALVVFTGGLGSSGTTGEGRLPPGTTTPARTPERTIPSTSTATAPTTGTPAPPAGRTNPAPATAPRPTTTGTSDPAGSTTGSSEDTTTPPSTTSDAPSVTTTDGSSTTTSTAPPRATDPATAPAAPGTFELTLDGTSEVYIEVKRRSETGDTVFAGRVGNGTRKRLTSRVPLWLNVSWAPNAIIRIDGRDIPVDGGTELYVARPSGLRRVTEGG